MVKGSFIVFFRGEGIVGDFGLFFFRILGFTLGLSLVYVKGLVVVVEL